MTQEDKELLLKDISARLPYSVVIHCTDNDTDYKCFLTTDILNELLHNIEYYDYKPYLRPMSSMTEEEKDELYTAMDWYGRIDENGNVYTKGQDKVYRETFYDYTDWFNAHHFDYRGLIEKELALEAPEGMYNLA